MEPALIAIASAHAHLHVLVGEVRMLFRDRYDLVSAVDEPLGQFVDVAFCSPFCLREPVSGYDGDLHL